MRNLLVRRHRIDLVLDALFALWVLHILVTGSIVPSPVTALFHNERPVVASLEPDEGPSQIEDLKPSLPET